MMLVAGVSRRSRQGGQYTGGASNSGGRRSSVVFPSGNGDLARWAVERHESNIGVMEEPAAVTACSPMRPVVDTARRYGGGVPKLGAGWTVQRGRPSPLCQSGHTRCRDPGRPVDIAPRQVVRVGIHDRAGTTATRGTACTRSKASPSLGPT
jgi:hypothetical protein